MHRIVWFIDALWIVRAEGFQDTLRRPVTLRPQSRKAVQIPGLTPRRATSRMASMPLLVHGLRWYRSSLARGSVELGGYSGLASISCY